MAWPSGNFKEAAPLGAYRVNKTITFDGGVGSGGVGTVALFTVTGAVFVRMLGHCTTSLTEGGATATIAIGVTGLTTVVMAQINAVDLDIGEIWGNAAPADAIALAAWTGQVIGGGEDIFLTVGTDTVETGVVEFACFWTPISGDGLVVAA